MTMRRSKAALPSADVVSKSEAREWARKKIEKWRESRIGNRYGILSPLYKWGFDDGVHSCLKLFGESDAEVSKRRGRKKETKE